MWFFWPDGGIIIKLRNEYKVTVPGLCRENREPCAIHGRSRRCEHQYMLRGFTQAIEETREGGSMQLGKSPEGVSQKTCGDKGKSVSRAKKTD